MKFTDGFWQLRPGVEALYAWVSFARRDDHVIFGRIVTRIGFAAEIDEPVGFARHGGDDNGDLIAEADFARDEFRHGANPLGARHRRAPEFHHDPRHVAPLS
jgi:hypothetical protein